MNYKTALAVLGVAIILPAFGAAAQLRGNISTPVIANQTAATPLDFSVNYFAHLEVGATVNNLGLITGSGTPEEYVDIVNPGTNGASQNSENNGVGDLCALIYIVDEQEEVEACCGCLITPDELLEIPVQADLLNNPNNGRPIHNGAIKIISSAPTGTPKSAIDNTVCNAAAPNPTPTLVAWMTHTRAYTRPAAGSTVPSVVFDTDDPGLGVTESEFQFAPLSAGEQSFLSSTCTNILQQGSGAGICTCPAPSLTVP